MSVVSDIIRGSGIEGNGCDNLKAFILGRGVLNLDFHQLHALSGGRYKAADFPFYSYLIGSSCNFMMHEACFHSHWFLIF